MAMISFRSIYGAACNAGHLKARLPPLQQLLLGFLGGGLLALGALLGLLIGLGNPQLMQANPGVAALLYGAGLAVGPLLVILTTAEMLPDNVGLILPACLARAARWRDLGRNWGIVFAGNIAGALFVVFMLAYWTGIADGGAAGEAAARIAQQKVGLSWGAALLRGIGGGWLVGLGVWLATAVDDTWSRVLGLGLPLAALGALGFGHVVADATLVPLGMLNGAQVTIGAWLLFNLLPVLLGNIIGAGVLVACAYWWLHGRD